MLVQDGRLVAELPDGLTGDAIPIEARIVACCDAFNAMTTDCAYRAALSWPDALNQLRVNRGTQFDPDVVDCLLALHPDPPPPSSPPAPAPSTPRVGAPVRV